MGPSDAIVARRRLQAKQPALGVSRLKVDELHDPRERLKRNLRPRLQICFLSGRRALGCNGRAAQAIDRAAWFCGSRLVVVEGLYDPR